MNTKSDAMSPEMPAKDDAPATSKRNNRKPEAPDLESKMLTPGYRVPPLRNRRQCARFVATLLRAGARGHLALEAMNRLIAGVQVLQGMYGDLEDAERLAVIRAEVQELIGREAPSLMMIGRRPAIAGVARRDDE